MAFYPGQKIICIDADSGRGDWFGDGPVKGQVYTFKRYSRDNKGFEVIHLYELERCEGAKRLWGPNAGYGAFRFRAIVEKKTDISVFNKLLITKRATEQA